MGRARGRKEGDVILFKLKIYLRKKQYLRRKEEKKRNDQRV